MALRSFINGIALVVLFAFALLFFMSQMLTLNNPDGEIANSPFINRTTYNLQQNAQDLADAADNAKERLEQDQPSTVYLFLIVYSAFAIPFTFITFAVGSLATLIPFLFTLFFGAGSSPLGLVAGVVSAILMIGLVFYILRAIRTGETER